MMKGENLTPRLEILLGPMGAGKTTELMQYARIDSFPQRIER